MFYGNFAEENMTPAEKLAEDKKKKAQVRVKNRRILFPNCILRKVREDLGLSQRDVVKGTGVTCGTISCAENGYGVGLEIAIKIAKFFGKSIEEIWGLS